MKIGIQDVYTKGFKKSTINKDKLKRNLVGYSFIIPALVLLITFVFTPFALTIYYAFTDYYLLKPDATTFIGLENFKNLMQDEIFITSIKNTFYFVIVVVPIQTALALGLALLIRQKTAGIKFFRTAFFSPTVMSMVVVSILWTFIYNPNGGLLNEMLGMFGIPAQPFLTSPKQAMNAIILMSAWQGAGYQMMIFLAGLNDIPEHLYEAASMDGANSIQKFIHITIPGLKNVLVFVFITITIAAFKLLIQPMVMTQGGPLNSTKTIIYNIYETGYKFRDMGYAAAMSVVFLVLVLVISLVQRKVTADKNA